MKSLIERLKDSALVLSVRQPEWVEHLCVHPGDPDGCEAAYRMEEAATALSALQERIEELERERDELAPRRVQKLRDALTSEGHAYEESLEREDGWIARCEASEAQVSALQVRERELLGALELAREVMSNVYASFVEGHAPPELAEGLDAVRSAISKTQGTEG